MITTVVAVLLSVSSCGGGAPQGLSKVRTGGYSYPVPANPLVLPTRARAGKLVGEDTSHLLVLGLRHQQFDSYDPADYDHNSPDYPDFTLNIIDSLPLAGHEAKQRTFRRGPAGQVIQSGISRQPKSVDPGRSKVNTESSGLLAVKHWLNRGRK